MSTTTSTALALRRLQASRAELSSALAPGAHASSPMLGLAWTALGAWWRQQPAAAALRLLSNEVQAQMTPLLHRYPLAVVAAAAILGSAFAALRPWRLVMSAKLGPWLLAKATSAPVLTALAALVATAVRNFEPAPAASTAPLAPSDEPVEPIVAAHAAPPATP